MLEKIKTNLNKIVFVLALFALCFYSITLIGYFDDHISESTLISLVFLGLVMASAIVTMVLALKNNFSKATISIPVITLLGAYVVNYTYSVIYSGINSPTSVMNSVSGLAVYGVTLALYIIALANDKLKKASLISLCFVAVYMFLYVLGNGSTQAAAFVMLDLSFIAAICFENKEGENK